MSKRKSFLIILAIICLVMVSTLSVIKAALLHSNGEINSLSGKTTNNPDFTIKEKTETKADNKTKLQRVNEDLLALLKENNINLEGCSSTVVEDLDYILVQVKKEDIETVKKLASDFEAKTGVCVSVKKQLAELPDGHENSGSFNQTKLVIADGMLMQSFYQNCVGIVYPDWFGGSLIYRDAYVLFIAKDKGGITVKELDTFFGDTASDVFYFITKNSYNELIDTANKVAGTLLSEGYALCEYYVNTEYEGAFVFIGVNEMSLSENEDIRNTELQNIQNRATEIAEEMGRGDIPFSIEAVEQTELQMD